LIEAILQRSAASIVVRGKLDALGAGARRIVGGANGIALLGENGGVGTQASTWNGSALLVASMSTGSFLTGFGEALAFDATGRSLAAGGGPVVSDANQPGTRTTAYLARHDGTVGAAEYAHGHYDFVGFAPERLSNSNLQALAVAA
jgi:hypothetical protein